MNRAPLGAALALAALLLAGCGSAAPQSTAVTSAPPSAAPTQALSTPHVYTTPPQYEQEAVKPDPNFDMGYAVHITAQGFQPNILVSPCCQAISFRNLSGKPADIVFDVSGLDSGVIAPGATWTWSPQNVESVAYHSKSDANVAGGIQVNQVNE